jgi:Tol biopolymer transport system component
MGEVYRARDTKLGREVAIKLLPAVCSSDEDRLARFRREATLLASLNHTNVATLHGMEESGSSQFLVMELVEGEDLAAKLERGPMSPNDALAVCSQVASSLEAAHAKGIIHRDLKPGNIRVTPDGTVKVLDFGLAKELAGQSGDHDISNSPTVIESGRTVEGVVLGTAAYMSPEQARGREVDRRTDIWALGCVLYECLTGKKAFPGETVTDTLAKILERDPDWNALPAAVSPGLRRLLKKCLEKDPQKRWRDAGDVGLLIDEVRGAPPPEAGSGTVAAAGRKSARPWVLASAALTVVAAAFATAWVTSMDLGAAAAPTPPKLAFTQLTVHGGMETGPNVSPDGSFVVYESSRDGDSDIYLQRVGGHKQINLTENSPENDYAPAFSPDGSRVAFESDRQGGGIFVMGSTGESVRKLSEDGHNPEWSPDGSRIAYCTEGVRHPYNRNSTSQIWTMDPIGGDKRIVTQGDAVAPSWSPNGHRIAYWSVEDATGGQRDIWTVNDDGTNAVPVTQDTPVDWNPVWSPDGDFLYFASDRGGSMNLWRVPIDEVSGAVLADPQAMTAPAEWTGTFDISGDGHSVIFSNHTYRSHITKAALDASAGEVKSVVSVTGGSLRAEYPEISPDGRWIAFRTTGRQEDVYLMSENGDEIRKLTDDSHRDRAPSWAPDGGSVVFYSDRSGRYEIWRIRTDGSGLEQLTRTEGQGLWYPTWSPDGSRYYCYNNTGTAIIEAEPVPFDVSKAEWLPLWGDDGAHFQATGWSPDGKRLAGKMIGDDLRQSDGLFVYSFESGKYTRFCQDLSDFQGARWLSDGRRIVGATADRLVLLETETGKYKTILDEIDRVGFDISVSKDDSAVYYCLLRREADVWMATIE